MTTTSQLNIIKASALGQALEEFAHPATLTNNQDRLVYANEAFCRFYGYALEEITGLSPRILLPTDFPERRLRTIRKRAHHPDGGWDGPVVNRTKRRDRVVVHLRTFPITPEPGSAPLYYLGVCCTPQQIRLAEFRLISLVMSKLIKYGTGPSVVPAIRQRGSRQAEAVKLRSLGYATKEIANIMGISPDTVNVTLWRHRKRHGRT